MHILIPAYLVLLYGCYFGLVTSQDAAPVAEPQRGIKTTTTTALLPLPSSTTLSPDEAAAKVEAVTASKANDNFYFDPSPINQDVVEGSSVELRCDVSNRKHIIFYWELNNKKVTNTSRRFQEGSNLRILRVDRVEDAGGFRCIAVNSTTGVSQMSMQATLNTQWLADTAEVLLKVPRDAFEITAGVEVSLKCQCNGNSEPNVIWYKNAAKLLESDLIKFHKSRLKLAAVSVEDNGVYSCEASNPAGKTTSLQNFILSVPGGDGAELIVDTFTQLVLVRRGQSAAFNCEYTNAIMTEWYFGDVKLTNDTLQNKYTIYPNKTLVIHDTRPKDEGDYSCVGLASVGSVQKYTAQLMLAYLDPLTRDHFEPMLPPPGQPLVIPVGSNYNIKCDTPRGLPTPTQRWESPTNTEIGPEDVRISATDGVLSITDAQPGDNGNYTCVASNTATDRRNIVWVVVSEPPVISRHPQSIRVHEGQDAEFDCIVEGTPYPVTIITWTKEDKRIDPSSSHYQIDTATGHLRIKAVTPEDRGNYACVAKTLGHDSAVSFNRMLYVKKKLKFIQEPIDSRLELGEEGHVYCRADGDTSSDNPINVYWTKDGSMDLGDNAEDENGILTFKPVKRSNNGTYTCTASNFQGKINKTVYIDIVVKPWFKVHPQNVTAYEGVSVMIHCVVEGDPKPSVQWDKNTHVDAFDPTRFQILKNGSLFISKTYMEDIGRYGCTAGNRGGLIREDMYLTVRSGMPDIKAVDNFGMMKTIIIAVCSAVAYLAVVIGLTVYCSIRLVKMKNKNKRNTEQDAQTSAKLENGAVPGERTELMDKKEVLDVSTIKATLSDDTRSHASGISSSHQSHSSHPSSTNRSQSQNSYHKYNYPRHDLQTLGMLGKGSYGDVFLAKAHHMGGGGPSSLPGGSVVSGDSADLRLVVVKSLLSREENHHYEFRREMDIYSKMNHDNIVKLLGVCREMEPQFIITEYCEWGDLKQFLWALRKDNGRTAQIKLPPLTHAQKINMCIQVASGMEHLSNHRFIHKDLAARNVLLDSNLDLKIANLGLCRDIYSAEYFSFHGQLIPLRWMPPEAVLEDEFSSKGDIWSFGCFMYEVFSLGDLPHKEMSDEEVLKGLKCDECVLKEMPAGCTLELWQLIKSCMSYSREDRPTFSDLCNSIGDMTVDSDV